MDVSSPVGGGSLSSSNNMTRTAVGFVGPSSPATSNSTPFQRLDSPSPTTSSTSSNPSPPLGQRTSSPPLPSLSSPSLSTLNLRASSPPLPSVSSSSSHGVRTSPPLSSLPSSHHTKRPFSPSNTTLKRLSSNNSIGNAIPFTSDSGCGAFSSSGWTLGGIHWKRVLIVLAAFYPFWKSKKHYDATLNFTMLYFSLFLAPHLVALLKLWLGQKSAAAGAASVTGGIGGTGGAAARVGFERREMLSHASQAGAKVLFFVVALNTLYYFRLPLLYSFSVIFFVYKCLPDIKKLLLAPLSWTRADTVRHFALVIGGLLCFSLIYQFDLSIDRFFGKGANGPYILFRIGRLCEPFGMVDRTLPSLGFLHLLALLLGDQVLATTAVFCVKSLVMAGFVSSIMKMCSHRHRPNVSPLNPYIWTGPGWKRLSTSRFSNLDLSFPSGHSTTAVSIFSALTVAIIDSDGGQQQSFVGADGALDDDILGMDFSWLSGGGEKVGSVGVAAQGNGGGSGVGVGDERKVKSGARGRLPSGANGGGGSDTVTGRLGAIGRRLWDRVRLLRVQDISVPVVAKCVLYSLGLASGFARIVDGTHWPSDVFFGACLGLATGQSLLYVWHLDKAQGKRAQDLPAGEIFIV